MNKRKLLTNREGFDMEDDYKVEATLSFSSTGHPDTNFPDTEWNLSFDATDANLDTIMEKFRHMLVAMEYVIDGRRLQLVRDEDLV